MVSETEPTGILAGRPIGASASASTCNNNSNSNNNNNRYNYNNQPGNSHPQNDTRKDNNPNKRALELYDLDERHMANIYIRPSWTDAAIALDQVEKGKAGGQRSSLWIRAKFQDHLSEIADFLQRNAGKVLFVTILILGTFSIALKSVKSRNKVEYLWVEEGGTLEEELNYAAKWLGESTLQTHQLIISMPKHSGENVLHPEALKEHLDIISQAMQVTVDLFDSPWNLKDICVRMTIPGFEEYNVEQIFEKLIPCNIMSPLECFWEGSKLMGPDVPIHIPSLPANSHLWTKLDPLKVVEYIKNTNESLVSGFPFHIVEDYMEKSGITHGYQKKPCLEPMNPNCPETAPNKKSRRPPDIGAELTGGCHGFASKYMHWPEGLLVGGAKRNRTGHLTYAAALQTVIQLLSERELYEAFTENYRTHHVGWTPEKASQVLESWQRDFVNKVKQLQQQSRYLSNDSILLYDSYAFSTITMNDIIGKHSSMSLKKIGIGCALVILYTCGVLFRWQNPMFSQSGMGLGAVIIVCATIIAGLGFCVLLGLPFNVITTQVLPYLLVGIGCHDTFLVTHADASESCNVIVDGGDESRPLTLACGNVLMSESDRTNIIVKRIGLSIFLKGMCTASGLGSATILPIPALRTFALKAAILSILITCAMVIVFPALLSLDLRRRKNGRMDLLCCCFLAAATAAQINRRRTHMILDSNAVNIRSVMPNNRRRHLAGCRYAGQNELCIENGEGGSNDSNSNNRKDGPDAKEQENEPVFQHTHYCHHHQYGDRIVCCRNPKRDCLSSKFTFRKFAYFYYGPFITRPLTKIIGMLLFAIILIGSVLQGINIEDGLELGDLVPQQSKEHIFLEAQSKYYGFYNMFAVTKSDFNYPNNQKLLYDYHNAFTRIKNVIKTDDGKLPPFWLGLFRDWLKGLQAAFDRDYKNGYITQEGWNSSASDQGIFGYKLLVQTGQIDNPVEKQLINQVRLVDADGIINPRAFYNYLTAWYSNDPLAYGASQASLRPKPRVWDFLTDKDLVIPKSPAIAYAQMPFYLHRLNSTSEITDFIRNVRELTKKFEELGLPNFPYGIPFIFWEQYLHLRRWLMVALATALGSNILINVILLLNVWAALLVGISQAGIVLQLFGVMGLFGMKLNAISAVLLVISVGISVHFTADICLSFVTCVGSSRDRRVQLTLEHMFGPVIHGAVITFLPILMLAYSDFEFIARYFFPVLASLIAIGVVNGLFFFPILLSLIGPSSEITPPKAHPDRIATPTPPASPEVTRRKRHHYRVPIPPEGPPRRPHKIDNNSSRQLHQLHAEPSLTTITEEPNSWHSTQESCIIVQPEVKVETTSTCSNQNCNGGGGNGGVSDNNQTSPVLTSTPHIITTTKVTATANIKVQVHTPMSGGMVDRSDKCRHSSSPPSGSSSQKKSCCNSSSSTSSTSSSNGSNATTTNINEKVFNSNHCRN